MDPRPSICCTRLPEPAEPASNPWYGRPLSSVWYQWTAPNSGPFRFAVSSPQGDGDGTEVLNGEARYDRIEVFDDGALAALRPVTGGLWSVTFFAKQGVTYPIRVAGSARGSRMELRWSPASRPANDNFADASVLEGESGRAEGTTEGATLEPGEFFGSHAATTWFRWTAPESGDWQFDNRSKRVLVFEGSELSELRLVSRLPETWTRFPAGAGREYRIAVADRDAYDSGGELLSFLDETQSAKRKRLILELHRQLTRRFRGWTWTWIGLQRSNPTNPLKPGCERSGGAGSRPRVAATLGGLVPVIGITRTCTCHCSGAPRWKT